LAINVGSFFINFQWPAKSLGVRQTAGVGLPLHPFTMGGAKASGDSMVGALPAHP
jgi:hypothetical protein